MTISAKSKGTDFREFEIQNFGFSSIEVSKHGYDKFDTHNKACLKGQSQLSISLELR